MRRELHRLKLPCPGPTLLLGPWLLSLTTSLFRYPHHQRAPQSPVWPGPTPGHKFSIPRAPHQGVPSPQPLELRSVSCQTLWTGALATCRSGSCGQSTSTGCRPWARPSRSWGARNCVPCRRSSSASAHPWEGTCCTPTWTSGNQVGRGVDESSPSQAPSQGH